MQPNNQEYSTNYLDTIATTSQRKTINPFVLWGLIAGVLIALVVVVSLLLSGGSTSTDKLTTLAVRLAALETITTEAQENIKSSELRTVNSSLSLVLANTNRDIEPSITAQKIKLTDKKNKKIATLNSETTTLGERLEDARLNGVFDSTYKREIIFYLKNIRADMNTLNSSTKSLSLQTALESADKSLLPLLGSFEAYKAD